jgi:hypothetical protein
MVPCATSIESASRIGRALKSLVDMPGSRRAISTVLCFEFHGGLDSGISLTQHFGRAWVDTIPLGGATRCSARQAGGVQA